MRTLRDVLSALRQNEHSFLRLLTDDLMEHTITMACRCGYDENDLSETMKAVIRKLNGGLTDVEDHGYICLEHLFKQSLPFQEALGAVQDYQAIVGEVWRAYNVGPKEDAQGKKSAEATLHDAIKKHSLVLEATSIEQLNEAIESEVIRVKGLVDPNNSAQIPSR